VVTPQQSAAIVSALQAVGILNASGWVVANPQGYNDRRSPVFGWVRDVYRLLPWMAGGSPSLNLELRTSAIFQELGVAYARHESIADYFTACLMWCAEGGVAWPLVHACAGLERMATGLGWEERTWGAVAAVGIAAAKAACVYTVSLGCELPVW
jgi:hypothetical protein